MWQHTFLYVHFLFLLYTLFFICQYDRKTNADTVWSVIYDIKNKKIYRVEGNPSRKQFKEDTRLKFIQNYIL